MRWLFRILFVILILVIAFTFSIKNQTLINVNFWDTYQVNQVQLGFVVIGAFAAGLIIGWLLVLWNKMRSSVKTGSVKRQLKKTEKQLEQTRQQLEADNTTS